MTSGMTILSYGYISWQENIAAVAESKVGWTLWSKASSHRTGKNTWKCNIFVAEVIEEAGGSVPHRWEIHHCWTPLSGRRWATGDIFSSVTVITHDKLYCFRSWWRWTPIGANEWGKSNSTYLKDSGCWTTTTSPSRGDIATDGSHVAVVTGAKETVSANATHVTRNNWGFDPPYRVASLFWRYTC